MLTPEELERVEEELKRLRQKLRSYCGGPEVEALRMHIAELEKEMGKLR